MKSISPILLLLVWLTAFAFILPMNHLPPADRAAGKTITPSPNKTKSTRDPSTATVTRTATQGFRKAKLYPGLYQGTVQFDVGIKILNQPLPRNWNQWNHNWTGKGTLYITVSNTGVAKARLVFNQIDGAYFHDDMIDVGSGFTCRQTGIVEGHMATISQTVAFNPADGSFSIPFNIFNVNTYGIYFHKEGNNCAVEEADFLKDMSEDLKNSTLTFMTIDFTVDTVESGSAGTGGNRNCAVQAWADMVVSFPTYFHSCHWQVYKLTKQPNGWKK